MTKRAKKEPEYTRYVPFVGKDHNLRMLLYLTETALNEARQAQVVKAGLALADADVLFLVGCLEESVTPAALSRWLKRKPSTFCEQLDRLEARGLVKRLPIKGNNKSIRVVLTDQGQASLQRTMAEDIIPSIVDSLSESEYRQLWRLLEKLKESALAQARQLKAAESSAKAH
jgi:DNA-binding MarR family transcriptional regulator